MSPVGERVAACVPEHMRVGLKSELGLRARPLDHAGKPSRGEGRSPFRCEDEGRLRLLLTLEPPQSAQFVPEDRVRRRSALLDPTDVQGGRFEVHLIHLQYHRFPKNRRHAIKQGQNQVCWTMLTPRAVSQ
jgi:hypothetical protein